MFASVHSEFWWGLAIATAIAIAATLRLKIWRADEYLQMDWMDWCGYYAMLGIPVIIMGGLLDSSPVLVAGTFMIFPLYPIALLGLIGKLDDMLISFIRSWRRR